MKKYIVNAEGDDELIETPLPHTPTPWKRLGRIILDPRERQESSNLTRIRFIVECRSEEDAIFVVRAVNAHKALIEAAKTAADYLRKSWPLTDRAVEVHNMLDKALAAAEGK